MQWFKVPTRLTEHLHIGEELRKGNLALMMLYFTIESEFHSIKRKKDNDWVCVLYLSEWSSKMGMKRPKLLKMLEELHQKNFIFIKKNGKKNSKDLCLECSINALYYQRYGAQSAVYHHELSRQVHESIDKKNELEEKRLDPPQPPQNGGFKFSKIGENKLRKNELQKLVEATKKENLIDYFAKALTRKEIP